MGHGWRFMIVENVFHQLLGLGDCRFWEDRLSANGVQRRPEICPAPERSLLI